LRIPQGVDMDDPAENAYTMKETGAKPTRDDKNKHEYEMRNAVTGARFIFEWQNKGALPSYWRLDRT